MVKADRNLNRSNGFSSITTQLNRQQRIKQLGVDCVDTVVWQNWSTGSEFSKVLDIQNRLSGSQVIEYSLPENKATFFLEFPEPVTLAPGMVYSLHIKFRPTQRMAYHDRIEIRTKQGSFFVTLEAPVPHIACQVDKSANFGMCPVKETAEQVINLKNTGTMPASFTWQVEPPFSILPAAGMLKVNQSQSLKVTFRPDEASSFVAKAVCRVSGEVDDLHDEVTASISLQGIGKYPFIQCKTGDLDFGTVICGKEVTQTVVVDNRSPVTTRFTIKKVDTDLEECFSLTPVKGTIPAGSAVTVKVTYNPVTAGTFSCDSFKIETPGGNTVTLRCQGQAVGPEVTIGVCSLNFGDHPLGAVVEKSFRIHNHSWVPAQFQWLDVHPGCGFEFSPSYGTISGCDKMHKGTATCTVRFQPSEAMNYYHRCFCLINNQSTLLYIDLLGSGYDEKEKRRPAPFTQHDVDVYRARIEAGLSKTTPEEVERALSSLRDETLLDEDVDSHMRDTLITTMNTTSFSPPTTEHLWKEVFTSSSDHMMLPFSLDQPEIDFGAALRSREGRPIHVRNNTTSRARAVWCLPTDSCAWEVQPRLADVGPFSSQEFRVFFKPQAANRFYHTTLECYAFYKTMRSFRLVNKESFTPPTCLTLYVHGHTFPPMEAFTPYAELSRSLITFPACHPSATIYQTVMLTNKGEQPLHYRMTIEDITSQLEEEYRRKQVLQDSLDTMWEDELSPDSLTSGVHGPDSTHVFSCYPTSGVVPVGGHQLVAFRFQPHAVTRYRAWVQCKLNEQDSNQLQLQLQGQSCLPRLLLSDNGALVFKPTQVRTSTTRSYIIENPSRVALTFTWQLPPQAKSTITIEPNSGLMRGNERVKLKVTFHPTQEKKYLVRIPCACSVVGLEGDPHSTYRATLTVVGEGQSGGVTLEPPQLDFGDVQVGTCETRQLTLFNSSGCEIQYTLGHVLSEESAAVEGEGKLLEFSAVSGILPARAHAPIQVRFTPSFRARYRLVAYCKLSAPSDKANSTPNPALRNGAMADSDISLLPQCEIVGRGMHPMVSVTDVRSLSISRAHLWQQLQVNALNATLQEELSATDKARTLFSIQQIISICPAFRMDFGAAIVESASVVVHVELTNLVPMAVQFSVRFPDETDLQPELWWPVDAAVSAEKQLDLILRNNVFDVQPRRGTISPNSTMTIQIIYRHCLVGEHRLPVLFDIQNGKRVCLDLQGKTLAQGEPHLQLPSLVHTFQPVAIGDSEAPVQYYELHNDSPQVVHYALDTSPLMQLQAENYDFPILQCQNPVGTILAFTSVWLRWRFTPLEAKLYTASCTISANEAAVQYHVTFQGEGYHSKKVSATQLKCMQATEFAAVPEAPRLIISQIPMALSLDVIKFGRVAYHSLSRRFLILKNHSTTHTYSYHWNTSLPYGNADLSVTPTQGSLSPGQSQICKMMFLAGSMPQILDLSVGCTILNLTASSPAGAKRSKEAAPPTDKLEMSAENCDTKKSTQSRRSCLCPSNQNGHKVRRPLIETSPLALSMMQRSSRPQRDADTELDPCHPTTLSVRVQVRVMSLEQLKEYHNDQVAGFWFPELALQQNSIESPIASRPPTQGSSEWPVSRGLAGAWLKAQVDGNHLLQAQLKDQYDAVLASPPSTMSTLESSTALRASQASLYSSLLADMLRDVIHDPDVAEAFEARHLDRVPYYCEMAGTPRTASHSAPSTPGLSHISYHTPISVRPGTGHTVRSVTFNDPSNTGHATARSGLGFTGSMMVTEGPLGSSQQREMEKELQVLREAHEVEREATERRRVLQSGEFQVFMEEILEEFNFSILSEVAEGKSTLVPPTTIGKLRMRRAGTPPLTPTIPTTA